jgi:hypothetical protein
LLCFISGGKFSLFDAQKMRLLKITDSKPPLLHQEQVERAVVAEPKVLVAGAVAIFLSYLF